ncbi:MAG: hypothetical protein ABIG42_10000 [bacterium]
MTPSFVEELLLRIEERLNALENELHEMRVEISHIDKEIKLCAKCRLDMDNVRKYVWAGRGIALAIWGFIVTVINVIIGKWLHGN